MDGKVVELFLQSGQDILLQPTLKLRQCKKPEAFLVQWQVVSELCTATLERDCAISTLQMQRLAPVINTVLGSLIPLHEALKA